MLVMEQLESLLRLQMGDQGGWEGRYITKRKSPHRGTFRGTQANDLNMQYGFFSKRGTSTIPFWASAKETAQA